MKVLKRIVSVVCIITMLVLCVPVSASAATNPYPKWQDTEWVDKNGNGKVDTGEEGDGYQEVRCTHYAWQQAYDRLGIALPSGWGNGGSWLTSAKNAKYDTGTVAKANSIAVWQSGSYGHVAFVTSVSGNTMKVNEGGRQDLDHTASKGVDTGYSVSSKVGSNRGTVEYPLILKGFIYLDGSSSSSSLGFTPTKITAGNYYIMNKATGKYLAVSYGKDADGQNVQVAPFGTTTAFQHNISAVSTGYKIRPLCSSSRLVNPDSDSVSSGVNINLYKNVSSSDQWWYFQSAGSGYYYIRNVQNPSVALAVDNTSADYPNVYVATYTSGNSKQMWRLDTTSTYAIKYNANGGSGAPSSQTKYHNRDIKLSSTKPTRTGYEFKGWSTSSTATSATYVAGATYSKNAKATLYAVWKPNTLTIKYHTNGGSIDSTTYSESSGKICKNGSQYTKTYSYNNILHENGLTNASTFGLYKTGYTFTGWSTSKSGGTVFDQNDGTLKPTDITSKIKTGDATVTMYAQWEPNVLRIIYNVNGGTLNSDKYAVSNGNICYATGKETAYKFEYNNILAEKGLYNASTFGLSRTGYKFVGWGTSKSGGTVFDENDVTLKTTDITSKIKSGDCTVTLYAQWEQIQDVNNDGKINQKDVTALSRYLAKGWSVAINQTPADTNGDGKINQKDVTVLSRYLAGGWGVTLAQ